MADEEVTQTGRRGFAKLLQRAIGAVGLGLLLGRSTVASPQRFGAPELERLRKDQKGDLKVWSQEPFVDDLIKREFQPDREVSQDYARAYNRFARAYNRFGRAYNRFAR